MAGLAKDVLDELDPDRALGRIETDVLSDFLYAPHYTAVYRSLGKDLWDRVRSELSSGSFQPTLPITIEVPRPSGVTRPGTILPPADRLVYQSLVDHIAAGAFAELDPERSFSHQLLEEDPQGRMFRPSHECWNDLLGAVRELCLRPDVEYAIRADVAAYFETIDQHALVNLLRSSSCSSSAVNLIEELLAAWRERNSRGILQGMFPSDFLGNFYLCGLDGELEVAEVPSARYVDDIYLFYPSSGAAHEGLVHLCTALRRDGLHLNERKTEILEATRLLHEETKLDELFEEARFAAEQEAFGDLDFYILHTRWDPEEPSDDWQLHAEIELGAFERLFAQVEESDAPSDKIERFCLPFLGPAGSDIAVERALEGFVSRPYQAKLYSSYLTNLARIDEDLVERLEELWNGDELIYDWQRVWLGAALAHLQPVRAPAVTTAAKLVSDHARSAAVRAVAAQVVARHGSAARKRALRTLYLDEQSSFVRGALLFATQYFPTSERRACLKAWGGHSLDNALIAQAVRLLVSGS